MRLIENMSTKISYTPEQEKAITTKGKNLLVAAAAGSGKTRVLVDRVVNMVVSGAVSLENVLILTFTNAAASEMRERIEESLNGLLTDAVLDRATRTRLELERMLLTGADIATFHTFCQKIIRQHIEATDLAPAVRLGTEQELTILKHEVLAALLEDKYAQAEESFLELMDAYGDELGDRTIQEAILQLYTYAQSQPDPGTWLRIQGERQVGEDLFSLPGFERITAEVNDRLNMAKSCFEEALGLVSLAADDELKSAWQLYKELLAANIDEVEKYQGLFQDAIKQKSSALWDKWTQAEIKFGELRKKSYGELKEKFPELRVKFDELNEKGKSCRPNKFITRDSQTYIATEKKAQSIVMHLVELVIAFAEAFRLAKRERNIMDFDDMQHEALKILVTEPSKLQLDISQKLATDIAAALRENYRIIMIDEYQDTNALQESIINQLIDDNNLFIVGDVKQSIYRFRLADPKLFQYKYDSFPLAPAPSEKNQLIAMSGNFRSRAEVLEPINYIFAQLMQREVAEIAYDEKSQLLPLADFPEFTNEGKSFAETTVDIELLIDGQEHKDQEISASEEDKDVGAELSKEKLGKYETEAKHIASRIKDLVADNYQVYAKGDYRPLQYSDIVILCRSVSDKADIFLDILRKEGIPAYADTNSAGYFIAPEIKLLLAILSVIDNSRRDIDMAAVLVSPIGGISLEDIANLRLLGDNHTDSLIEIIRKLIQQSPSEYQADFIDKLKRVETLIAGWREFVQHHGVPELIWKIYRDTGYYDYVGALNGGLLRQANLRMLIEYAGEYERSNTKGLFSFLRYIDNLKQRNTDLTVARTLGESENVVRIMSIHHSKGLEFPVVILASIDKAFNTNDVKGNFILHTQKGIGIKVFEQSSLGKQKYDTLQRYDIQHTVEAENKAEELRLLYVAMTRAKEKLILTGVIKDADSFKKKIAEWQAQFSSARDGLLPLEAVRKSKSYLDWLMLALGRHPDAGVLYQSINDELTENSRMYADAVEAENRFTISLIDTVVKNEELADESMPEGTLQSVRLLEPLPDNELTPEVTRILNWRYSESVLTHIPGKLTVTEIKNRFAIEEDEEAAASFISSATDNWPSPSFMRYFPESAANKCKIVSAAERGTIMHRVMQQLKFGGEISAENISAQLEDMVASHILRPEDVSVVDKENIMRFLQSELGERLQQARNIYRELPFSRLLPAKQFYDEVESDTEMIFIQGIIDVLFEDNQGELILLDYKTDRNLTPEMARQRYEVQLKLYGDAVEAILARPISERFVFLLNEGEAVKI